MGIYRGIIALTISATAVIFLAFVAKLSEDFSRFVFIGGAALSGALIFWVRLQLRDFVTWRCGSNVVNELMIDAGGPQIDMPNAIRVKAEEFDLVPDLQDPHSLDRFGLVLRNIDRAHCATR